MRRSVTCSRSAASRLRTTASSGATAEARRKSSTAASRSPRRTASEPMPTSAGTSCGRFASVAEKASEAAAV